MGKECASGFMPTQNTTAYTLTKAEFTSIFGGGNDTVVQDFFFYDGDIPKAILLPQGFCNMDLGEYENISNLEILTSLLLVGGVVTTAIALLLPYLKILRNVNRFLQESRVCDCKKATDTNPDPNPDPDPVPDPTNPVPPNTCCTDCFQEFADTITEENTGYFINQAIFRAEYPNAVRGAGDVNIPVEPLFWQTLPCSAMGLVCQVFVYNDIGGLYVDATTNEPIIIGQFQQTTSWSNGKKILFRHYCDNEPQPTPTPTPTPTPLPPDNFDFCEQFPALCNACPDVGNSQDVVVSGKIASTCDVKDDISFNVKF